MDWDLERVTVEEVPYAVIGYLVVERELYRKQIDTLLEARGRLNDENQRLINEARARDERITKLEEELWGADKPTGAHRQPDD